MPRTAKRFWQTEKFKQLQIEWEGKLNASGFRDAEANGKLCQNAPNCYRTKIQTVIEGKLRYYELLGHWYHEEKFKCPTEEHVMRRRSEAATWKQIEKELRILKRKNSRETIRKIIRHFEKKWGIIKKKT